MPDDIEFLTKPALATGMLTRALRRRGRRRGGWPGTRSTAPTPACAPSARPTGSATCWRSAATAASRPRPGRSAPTQLAAGLPRRAWQRLSAGAGRERASATTTGPGSPSPPTRPPAPTTDTQCWWLLVRRHRDTGELAFYRCYSPQLVPLRELVRVAGRRWTIEESFQAGKGLAGLDEHQVRRWTSWRRWTLLAMIAHALLAVIAAPRAHRPARTRRADRADLQRDPPPVHHPTSSNPAAPWPARDAWSHWRRRHQHRARTSHYQRQEDRPQHS